MTSHVVTEVDDRVGVITINRPDRHNAFDVDTVRQLRSAFADLQESEPRAIVLTGSGGRAFSAGGDIKAYAASSPAQRLEQTDTTQALLHDMIEMPIPVIAAIEGYCLGGGLELALGCDVRVAGRGSQLGLPEVALHALPSVAGYRLARYVGLGRAEELVLLGRRLSADEAHQWGLVTEVVDSGRALGRAREIAVQLAEQTDAVTVARAKALIQFGFEVPDRTGRFMNLMLDELQTSSDAFSEGVAGFGER